MSRLTVFLARFIGLFTVLLVVALLARGSASVAAAVADGPVMLLKSDEFSFVFLRRLRFGDGRRPIAL